MSAEQKDDKKKTISLSGKTLQTKKAGDSAGHIRQSFSHGRTKTVTFEVKKKRFSDKGKGADGNTPKSVAASLGLTEAEWEARLKALQGARKAEAEAQLKAEEEKKRQEIEDELNKARQSAIEEAKGSTNGTSHDAQNDAISAQSHGAQENIDNEHFDGSKDQSNKIIESEFKIIKALPAKAVTVKESAAKPSKYSAIRSDRDDDSAGRGKSVMAEAKKSGGITKRVESVKSQYSRFSSTDDSSDDVFGRPRFKRHAKKKIQKPLEEQKKIIREVIVPEVITVQELSNRMATRAADVVKCLMQMGVMATVTQSIDAETAELVVLEFGHTPKLVAMTDVEIGLEDITDAQMIHRAPVVTVMGHVDHGKTSLLDAIKKTDVVSGEAGGITQHIGAYQVTLPTGQKLTFIDTPGHAAFSEMRSRGANVTDIVILVVAADDGIKEQTVEAINHAKAAQVPIIVAINKIDKPGADPQRVRNELLQHELVVEELGGDIMNIEVSAKKQTNLDKLLEAVLVQAEVLDLEAPRDCRGSGVVVEAKIERGRGSIATVLMQKGTLRVGDVFVAGTEYGRIRAMTDDHGHQLKEAYPSMPVEIIGFGGAPVPGDAFIVVESETRAREVAEFRLHQQKEKKAFQNRKNTMDNLFSQANSGLKELTVVIKSDVQGSLEAIQGSFSKLTTDEVAVKVLHSGVGAINESDMSLAKASNALVIGFNVRANPQAREIAAKDDVEIRYYSIIYDVIDDVRALLGGMLSPILHENFLGYAAIRQVFNITKVGKIAGCMVTQGIVKRGAKVRLLRDNVVIHEGSLKTLKRMKDEVKEAREGYECGMSLENYSDIREGDVIECFEIESKAREL